MHIIRGVKERLQRSDAFSEEDGGKARRNAQKQGDEPELDFARPIKAQHVPDMPQRGAAVPDLLCQE